MTYDLAIAGAGPAGLTCAIFAAQRGLRVVLLDCADTIGGALNLSRGHISGAGTKVQAQLGIEDSPEAHFDAVMQMAAGTNIDTDFLTLATQQQREFVDWLVESGFDLAPYNPTPNHHRAAGGTPRTYVGREQGRSIIAVLSRELDKLRGSGAITLHLNTRVDGLITIADRVAGLCTVTQQFPATATLLATGGYAANAKLFAQLHGGARLWSGAYPWALGQGLELGLSVGGAKVIGDTPRLNFGGILDPFAQPPRYRAPGGLFAHERLPWEIIVNGNGARFFAEDRKNIAAVTAALAAQPDSRGWLIYDEAIRQNAPALFRNFTPTQVEQLYSGGTILTAPDLPRLAAKAHINADELTATIAAYNQSVACGSDPFGRTHLPHDIDTPPFYALPIAAYAVRSTVGLRTDLSCRVLRDDGRPIPGLYAAGEVMGALFGNMALSPALALGRYLGMSIEP